MDSTLEIVPEKCTGCRQCELACSWVQTGSFQPAQSLIRVYIFDEEASFAPYTCLQCNEAWCMTACPVNAITTDPQTGAKRIVESLCIDCHLCTLVCPFGTMFTRPVTDDIPATAAKCNLCGGDPACVAWCPTEAIVLRSPDVDPSLPAGTWLDGWGRQVQAGRAAALNSSTAGGQ